jgi:predicted nucleotidyltransferase
MDEIFNIDKAKRFLESRELEEKEKRETDRNSTLVLATNALKDLFSHTDVEVYLIGSITKPHMFSPYSDVDVVLRNFKGDRFDVWTGLETIIKKKVEVIIFENCLFQEYILKNGYKVI